MTTIVSAFILCPNNTNRIIEDYIKYGIQLLKLPHNKIIFIDEKVFEFVESALVFARNVFSYLLFLLLIRFRRKFKLGL